MSLAWVVAVLLVAAALVSPAGATPTTVTVGPFDVVFYNKSDSDGTYRGAQNWTTQQMDDVVAAVSVWTNRITNTAGRQIVVHMFWYRFAGGILGGAYSPNNGDGTTSWTYTERVWRDGVNYAAPWSAWDLTIRFDTDAAGYGWNFGEGAPGATQVDFRSVVTHEVGHAVGFVDTYSSSTDRWGCAFGTSSDPFAFAGYLGLSAWDQYLRDDAGNRPLNGGTGTPGNFNQTDNPVWFVGPDATAYYGGSVPVYAPSPYESGSSLSHVDQASLPSALMSPFIYLGAMTRQPIRLEWEIMEDLGWSVLMTKTWTRGAGTLAWGDAANWGPGGIPDQTWDVLFTGAGLAEGETVVLGANRSVNVLGFDTSVTFTIGGTSGTLTLVKGNITRSAASAGTQTIARPVALGASAVWDVAGAGQFRVTGAVSGSGFGIEKRGAGTLLLSGTNSYTGPTAVKAGTLLVGAGAPSGSAGALGNATSAVLVGDTSGSADAALLISGAYTVGRPVTVQAGGSGTVTLGGTNTSGTATFSDSVGLAKHVVVTASGGGTVVFSGQVSGVGGLTKTGGGTVTVSGTSSYSGSTVVQAGALNLTGPVTRLVGTTLTGGTWEVWNGAALSFAPGANILTSQATVILDGPASGFANFATLADNQGSLGLLGGRTFTTAGALTNSGTLAVGTGSQLTLSAGFTQTAGSALFDGTLSVAAGNLSIQGGTLTASGPQQYAPGTLLAAAGGTVKLNSNAGKAAAGPTDPAVANLTLSLTGAAVSLGANQDLAGLTWTAGTLDLKDRTVRLYTAASGLTELALRDILGGGGILDSLRAPDERIGYTDQRRDAAGVQYVAMRVLYAGDVNADGSVSFSDFTDLLAGYGLSGRTWDQGDFTYDGLVSFDDFTELLANYGKTGGHALPEPATLALVALGAAGLALGRRRATSNRSA